MSSKHNVVINHQFNFFFSTVWIAIDKRGESMSSHHNVVMNH